MNVTAESRELPESAAPSQSCCVEELVAHVADEVTVKMTFGLTRYAYNGLPLWRSCSNHNEHGMIFGYKHPEKCELIVVGFYKYSWIFKRGPEVPEEDFNTLDEIAYHIYMDRLNI